MPPPSASRTDRMLPRAVLSRKSHWAVRVRSTARSHDRIHLSSRLGPRSSDFDPLQFGASAPDPGQRFPYFRFDDAAQGVFIEWMHELHRERILSEQADGHPLIAQHLVKYEKLFAALALILHLADCAAGSTSGPVTQAAALRAAAWCEYLEAHARRCYGLLADGGARAAAMLASRIERGALPDGFTARDVRRKRWRHLSSDSAVDAALEWLEAEGWIRPMPTEPRSNGPSYVALLNQPAISQSARSLRCNY